MSCGKTKVRLYDITWDTDGISVDDLPEEVIIDDLPANEMQELIDNIGYYDNDLANELSDRYGWCVESFRSDVI